MPKRSTKPNTSPTTAKRTTERATITIEITKTSAKIDRYLTAFENETLDEHTCAPRIQALSTKLTQLRRRYNELTKEIADEPTMPQPAQLTEVTTHIDQILSTHNPALTKALIEALVAEATITGPGAVIPVFRVPQQQHATHEDRPPPAETADHGTVRTLLRMAGRVGLEPTT